MKKRGPAPKPVTIRGVTYTSVKECAEAFGLSESHIYTMLNRGREDYIGLGTNSYVEPKNGIHITLSGKFFPSLREVDRFLGEKANYSSNLIYAKKQEVLEEKVREKLNGA